MRVATAQGAGPSVLECQFRAASDQLSRVLGARLRFARAGEQWSTGRSLLAGPRSPYVEMVSDGRSSERTGTRTQTPRL